MKQSFFSRTLANEAKLGAYYTDAGHMQRIGQMFSIPDETCVLEPSVGDASAVTAFLEAADVRDREAVKLYGVELDTLTYEKVLPKLDYGLNANFLTGTKITDQSFSLCVQNPPYGPTGIDGKDRLETKFVERAYRCVKKGGLMVLIVPYGTLTMNTFARSYFARFESLAIYRFDDGEYEKYHQFCLIGRRRDTVGVLHSSLSKFLDDISQPADSFPYLPQKGEYHGEIYVVPPSKDSGVARFCSTIFEPEKVASFIGEDEMFKNLGRRVFVPEYRRMRVSSPPGPLRRDHLYLCSISGSGYGLLGTDSDIHLQRGNVRKVVEEAEVEDPESGKTTLVETTSNRVVVTIIDSCGNTIHLE